MNHDDAGEGGGYQAETPGQRLVAGLNELLTTLKSGGIKAVEIEFTVTRIERPPCGQPPPPTGRNESTDIEK